jgi:hypothetical protein
MTRLGNIRWSLLACCGTESRSVALASHVRRGNFQRALVLTINDPDPLDKNALRLILEERRKSFINSGFAEMEVRQVNLLSGLDIIKGSVTELANEGATNLIVDITSFPKMWFFPIVQAALQDARFENVVVTYTSAVGYANQLSENVGPLRVLPGFYADDGRSHHASLVIGIGFEPVGIASLLSDQVSDKIRLIFPFPPGPPGHHRNWMFVKQIEDLTQKEEKESTDRVHIHMYDCPQVFDALCSMTMNGQETSAMAPYGPKTVSLAMCLFALAASEAGRKRVPVFYAQPHRYALDYTTGVGVRDNCPDVTGYCLKLGGRKLYTLTD